MSWDSKSKLVSFSTRREEIDRQLYSYEVEHPII